MQSAVPYMYEMSETKRKRNRNGLIMSKSTAINHGEVSYDDSKAAKNKPLKPSPAEMTEDSSC